MSLRRKSREFALQMLFQWDIGRQKPARIEAGFWKMARAADSTRKFANELFEGAVSQSEASDRLVEKFSQNWRLDRMAVIDRNILRLAVCELRLGRVPPKTIINEALELAKRFSSADAAPFLNGVLDAVLKSFPAK
jgi:N utilization substance protein B